MTKRIAAMALVALTLCVEANARARHESTDQRLAGTWRVAYSVPRVSPHHTLVFTADSTMMILDERRQLVEEQAITSLTGDSFVGKIAYVSDRHPAPEILGASRYALFDFDGDDRLIVSFYRDETRDVWYVTFHLVRSDDAEVMPAEVVTDRDAFVPDIIVDFDTVLPHRRFIRNGGRLDVVSAPAINDTKMGVITLPEGLAARELPKASFVIDYRGKLADVVTVFRTYVPGEAPYGSRAPYIAYAFDENGDSDPDG